jgi:hypothetical protein
VQAAELVRANQGYACLLKRETRIHMKRWRWMFTAVAVTVGVALFMGKDDIIRYNRMRRM